MKKKILAAGLTLGALTLAAGAQADSWDVTQKVTVNSATTMTQGNGNTDAVQAMNAINVAILNKTSQALEMGTNALTFSQLGAATTGSLQTANYIKATTSIAGPFTQDVNSAAAASAIVLTQEAGATANTQALNYATGGEVIALTQNVTPTGATGDISLTQKGTTGTGSLQAANAVEATTITSLTQAVDNDTAGGGDINLLQESGSSTIDQAGNYASAGTITALGQTITTVDLALTQTGGTSKTQVANHALATTTVNGALTQTATASGLINLTQQTTGTTNLQAVNAVDAAEVAVGGTVTQAATTGSTDISLTQSGQTTSQQFVNYLTSPGAVASVTQNYLNAGNVAALLQNGSITSSQQALNAIEMTGGADVLTAATQTISLDPAANGLDMGQGETTANTDSYQAGNLLISANSIATADQSVTADIAMDQAKGTGNVQAANLASGKNVTTKLTQTVAGTSDVLNQGATGAATNTQAGNYLDVAASGTVALVEQNYGATSAILDQDEITSGVQGLNVIDASAAGVTITSADQNLTVPSLTMRQGQDATTTDSLQAGNAVITAAGTTGGAANQDVTATTLLSMTQTNSNGSIQAANYVGYMPANL